MDVSCDGNPRTCRSKAQAESKPKVAQPGVSLHVGVDDEGEHRQPGHHQGDLIEESCADQQQEQEHSSKSPCRV